MKHTCRLLLLCMLLLGKAQAQPSISVRSAYLDFGPNDGTNGQNTPSPDVNGHFWNNISNSTAPADTVRLVDQTGATLGLNLHVDTNFATNGIKNGGLLTPDPALLGPYAVATATEDYFFVPGSTGAPTGLLSFRQAVGVAHGTRYVFHLFGSRQSKDEVRTSQYRLTGTTSSAVSLTTTGLGIGANGYNGNNNVLATTDTLQADATGVVRLQLSRLAGMYAYLNVGRVDVLPPVAAAFNPRELVFMGSSVAYGFRATDYQGYSARYRDLLARRAAAGTGQPWLVANVSIPGNNTSNVVGRYQRDLLPLHARYVVFALGLGNEGIHDKGMAAFISYQTNLTQLIRQARADGLVPLVTNSYPRNVPGGTPDYTATDYAYVKQMNLLMHGWQVPSTNLLGALDDLQGQGHWAPGYANADGLHPNDLGYAELSYTVVPSLFDALAAGKSLPTRRPSPANAGSSLGRSTSLTLTPEEVVHPFTQALRFRTSGAGQLLALTDSAGRATGSLEVTAGGQLLYHAARGGGGTIAGTVRVADNRWHKLVLTHYYALGSTRLYVDSTYEGQVAERLRLTRLTAGGPAAPARVQVREFCFYRSGMNQDEVRAMAADSLLKSSLEVYAPLDASRQVAPDSLANLAQSTNALTRVTGPLPVTLVAFTAQEGEGDVHLAWATASEQANLGFEVQVSADGAAFRTLGFVVSPHPTSVTAQAYQFIDKAPPGPALRYYRLRQVDVAGSATYSPVRSVWVQGPLAPAVLLAFPTPFTSELTLQLATPATGEILTVRLSDLTGQQVARQLVAVPAGADQVELPLLGGLPAGAYVVEVIATGGVQRATVFKR